MTTKKHDISRHKTTQVFDIIPRGHVRATATSRPVIPSRKPAVSDNTLTSGKRTPLTITPPAADPALTNIEEALNATGESLTPKEKGVSVADLLAKKTADDDAADIPPKEDPQTHKDELAEDIGADVGKDDDKKTDIDDDDSLAKALQADEAKPPQEHSEALKEAMKDLDSKDDNQEEGGRTHHELYGGKPVIVVHKDHPAMSALTWVLWFSICVLLAVAIVDVLLDAGIVKTNYQVPYTDFIQE